MHMVIIPTNSNRKESGRLCDASHILEDIFTESIRQLTLAVLCTEDNVVKQLLMSTHAGRLC